MRQYVNAILIFVSLIPAAFAGSPVGFALSEHWAMGQEVVLRFDDNEPAGTGTLLHLRNGLALTFGDILSLGDLYGVLGRPISRGLDKKQKQERFKDAFKTFAYDANAVEEVKGLKMVIQQEMKAVEAGIEKGETAEIIYKRIGDDIGRQINCLTGGACTQDSWWLYPGRYLLLSLENFDHFSPNNLFIYKNGHEVALRQAVKARRTGDRSDLELAYAMDAFACHFLSDHFAAGHLRTPREELSSTVTPAVLGSLLATYMQEEENKYGLHVYNEAGDHWIVYGDHSYFNPANQVNQQILLKALQQSADEVYAAYSSGGLPEKSAVLRLTPHTEQLTDENSMDIAPMFYWDKTARELYRRTDLTNPYDHSWTNRWWGWSTLMLLRAQYGVHSTLQMSLSRYAEQFGE